MGPVPTLLVVAEQEKSEKTDSPDKIEEEKRENTTTSLETRKRQSTKYESRPKVVGVNCA